MTHSRSIWLKVLIHSILFSSMLFSQNVPDMTYRAPAIPEFLELYQFQTIEDEAFSFELAGMHYDIFSKTLLNPAYLPLLKKSLFYSKLKQPQYYMPTTYTVEYPSSLDFGSSRYSLDTQESIRPRVSLNSAILNSRKNTIYNVAWLKRVNSRVVMGLYNLFSFDLQEYWQNDINFLRTVQDIYTSSSSNWETSTSAPETASADKNQQFMIKLQTQLQLAYTLTDAINLGVELQQNYYKRDGGLTNEYRDDHLHSLVSDLIDDQLKTDGLHHILTAGVTVRKTPAFEWGAVVRWGTGQGKEVRTILDTTASQFEDPADVTYRSHHYLYNRNQHAFNSNGVLQSLTLHGEWQMGDAFSVSSAITGTFKTTDLKGEIAQKDTAFWDYTYDTYDYTAQDLFLEYRQSNIQHTYALDGSGTEKQSNYTWFVKGNYQSKNNWESWIGLLLQYNRTEQTLSEYKSYNSEYWDRRTLHTLTNNYQIETYSRQYDRKEKIENWVLLIPLSTSIQLSKNFDLFIGMEEQFRMDYSITTADLSYPSISRIRIEDGSTTISDPESNRLEVYRDESPATINMTDNIISGFNYHLRDHLTIQVNTMGNILQPNSWFIGVQWK